jgi:PDZ domain-containing protein
MTEEMQWTNRRQRIKAGFARWSLVLLLVFVVGAGLWYLYQPVPYYVTRPGSAIELQPLVHVEGGKKDEAGAFMLTTVRMGEANRLWYWYAKLSPDVELIDKNLVLGHGETDEDFTKRELAVMENSQKIAEAIAFKLAGYPVQIEKQGVLVMGTIENMPAKNILQVGDIITAVDRKKTLETNDLLSYLAGKKAGDVIEVTFLRDHKERKASLKLAALPGETRPGIGIRPENKQLITVPQKVTISSQGIGGPSAGLMFTLEIYDQLNKEIDLTRGYRIAGTGTIQADGSVGRIGGISHKIVAADEAGAEIFFAPDDAEATPSNYQEALATAKRIGTSMKIVPVKHVEDALTFLKAQQPKPL